MSDKPPAAILVVEDEAIVSLDIESRLRGLGYEVIGSVPTAEEAIARVARDHPDLVLMDIHLKGPMDGIEAGGEIRKQFRTPVVYLTAHADEPTLARARETGPFGYLLKPFDAQKLRTTIEIALAKHASEFTRERQREDLLAVLGALPLGTIVIDREAAVSFANPVARRMLQLRDRDPGGAWQQTLGLSDRTVRRIQKEIARPVSDRRRFALWRSSDERSAIEGEVVEDPRDDAGLILFLHDVAEITALRGELADGAAFESMVGRSDAMRQVFRSVSDLAAVDSSVLIRGATGTGKELVARALHRRSHRAEGPFVAVNCAGLSDELANSHLFGHVRGSFTGAVRDHVGCFETADGGVLFLDEIGELSDHVQATLLRVLEEQEVTRVGDQRSRPVDVRLVAATHRDLESDLRRGRFRSDLYYRLRVAQIDLPALADRREDIPLLAEAFLDLARATTRKQVVEIDDEATACLLAHPWPGNVRELRNAIEFSVIRCRGEQLGRKDLPPEIADPANQLDRLTDGAERIRAAITSAGGNRKRAAELLGISRATLYRRLRQYGIATD